MGCGDSQRFGSDCGLGKSDFASVAGSAGLGFASVSDSEKSDWCFEGCDCNLAACAERAGFDSVESEKPRFRSARDC